MGLDFPQTKHMLMLLLLHREVWPITAHYRLDTRYAPRVLHFSAFYYFIILVGVLDL